MSPAFINHDVYGLAFRVQGSVFRVQEVDPFVQEATSFSRVATRYALNHSGGNPGANLKSISHRCHPILVAFVWKMTKETIYLPLG